MRRSFSARVPSKNTSSRRSPKPAGEKKPFASSHASAAVRKFTRGPATENSVLWLMTQTGICAARTEWRN